jgi:hypothetical protein
MDKNYLNFVGMFILNDGQRLILNFEKGLCHSLISEQAYNELWTEHFLSSMHDGSEL